MKKFIKGFLAVVLLIGVFFGTIFLFEFLIGPRVKVVTGWQEVQEINGIVPKGAIMVVSDSSNLVFPGDSQLKEQTGFVKQGVVFFYQRKHAISEGPVWIFFPEEYEFLVKIDDFSLQCNEKLSDLTGKTEEITNSYFIGHP